jgi:hypothetical protein
MDRRNFLRALTASAVFPFSGLHSQSLDLRGAAREAWLFGLPLIEMARTRALYLGAGLEPNAILHKRNLSTPADTMVTSPNNDTLYSIAWLDLAQGPVVVTLPKTGRRYFSVALMDMYTNNFAVLGTRTTGIDGGTFIIVGPQVAIDDPLTIRSPTPWVWLLARLFVDDQADLPAVHALQDQIKISGQPGRAPTPTAQRTTSWRDYFGAVHTLINENPPRATDAAVLARIAALGLIPGRAFNSDRFTSAEAGEIETGVNEARSLVGARRAGRVIQGWSYPQSNLGDFGQDYLYRAQVAVNGLAVLPNAEALYVLGASDQGGMAIDSSKNWQLRFEGNSLPPVDAFWSLTAYYIAENGARFLVENSINRYSIGDRTPGLRRSSDGSFDIWLSRDDPGGNRIANWLPTPKERPLSLTFRAYLPRSALINGDYLLPPLRPV